MVLHRLVQSVRSAHLHRDSTRLNRKSFHFDRAVFDLEACFEILDVERLGDCGNGAVERAQRFEVATELALKRGDQSSGVDRFELGRQIIAQGSGRVEIGRETPVEEACDRRVRAHRRQGLKGLCEAHLFGDVTHVVRWGATGGGRHRAVELHRPTERLGANSLQDEPSVANSASSLEVTEHEIPVAELTNIELKLRVHVLGKHKRGGLTRSRSLGRWLAVG